MLTVASVNDGVSITRMNHRESTKWRSKQQEVTPKSIIIDVSESNKLYWQRRRKQKSKCFPPLVLRVRSAPASAHHVLCCSHLSRRNLSEARVLYVYIPRIATQRVVKVTVAKFLLSNRQGIEMKKKNSINNNSGLFFFKKKIFILRRRNVKIESAMQCKIRLVGISVFRMGGPGIPYHDSATV